MAPGSRRHIYAVNAQNYTGQFGNFMTHLLQYGIPKESIQEVLHNFCDGYLKAPTAAEFETEYKKEICDMINRLNEEDEDSQTEKDLLLVCKRTLQLLGNGECIAITGIDPNGKAFPLPDDFGYFSPECLREWCWNDSYEPFETSEEPWYAYEKTEDPLPELLGSTEVYCNWLNDWEPFDFEIEGEAAWEILPTNVIQNDELTPEQIEIIKFREQRSDLTDPVRMANRRKRLAKYFMEKYNWDESHLKPYEEWAERLEENENMLAELSQLS
ncbi:uncharacterized protein LOC106173539 [Lingula anatina]|uniref:Uncharacterized protein LOC106173539 n=1 Tax=Lingula anatina TaxID=7574 RepID=A0A1S3JIB0_LINAN|nr:uncharacterized protein LOC106173539 [Lingula anatina]|eukprot:XP_013410150.1 uncharacterized protein LOC106173539 [Lingula anatina]